MLLVFQRKMEHHVFNIMFQTLMLKLIGFLTLFFSEENFTDRIMVTLTTMLVLATIMSSIQAVIVTFFVSLSFHLSLNWT